MADYRQDFCSALDSVLDSFESHLGFRFELKSEQRQSVEQLIYRGDLLAVLPTGFGKSLIFQLLVPMKKIMLKKSCCVLVICPLKSIIEDQVAEATSLGLKAGAISDVKMEDGELASYDLLFGSAEEVLQKRLLAILKKTGSKLCGNIVAVVVDESHTCESWTGSRETKKGKASHAFRESFGQLANLRSYCQPGTPVGAITGTADTNTQQTIKTVLCLNKPLTIYVSPNRPNLRFTVKKVKKAGYLKQLQWLVEMAKDLGSQTPKTIIFCTVMNDMASVVNYLVSQLGDALYATPDNRSPGNAIIGIYHSNSWQSMKDRVTQSFKGNGHKRIVVATTSLCMGVNFPDIRYIINWGPPRSILDQHQQSGRAGRDGQQSHVVVIYHGQQASPCEREVKEFIRAEGCLRVSAYISLDSEIKPSRVQHDCCSNCARECKCDGERCKQELLPFDKNLEEKSVFQDLPKRTVSAEDKADLKNALVEVLHELQGKSVGLDKDSTEWFSMALIDDVVQHCSTIFSIDDLIRHFPVFSFVNALRVLELIQELFEDIPSLDETVSLLMSKGMCLDVSHVNNIDFGDHSIYDDRSDSDIDELASMLEM